MKELHFENTPAFFRVVLIRNNGNRESLARNLTKGYAEAVMLSMASRGKVIVEQQDKIDVSVVTAVPSRRARPLEMSQGK